MAAHQKDAGRLLNKPPGIIHSRPVVNHAVSPKGHAAFLKHGMHSGGVAVIPLIIGWPCAYKNKAIPDSQLFPEPLRNANRKMMGRKTAEKS